MRLHTTAFLYIGLLAIALVLVLALLLLPDNKDAQAEPKDQSYRDAIERTLVWPA